MNDQLFIFIIFIIQLNSLFLMQDEDYQYTDLLMEKQTMKMELKNLLNYIEVS